MFGTLVSDSHRKEPLTFVENTDPASALRRSRRDKPHASCQLCRARKIRCSGQPSGCDRCTAIEVECWYPDRSGRRKRRAISLRSITPDESNSTSKGNVTTVGQEAESGQETEKKDEKEDGQVEDDGISATSPQTYPHQLEYASSSDSLAGAWDDLMDLDALSNTMLGGQLEFPFENSLDKTNDPLWNSLFEENSMQHDFGSIDIGSSSNSVLSLEDQLQSRLPPPFEIVPELTFDMPSIHSLSPASINKRHSENDRHGSPDPFSNFGFSSSEFTTTSVQPSARPAAHRQSRTASQTQTSSFPPSPIGADKPCSCRRLTANLFQGFCYESVRSDWVAMDALLQYFRGTLEQYAKLLDCDRCVNVDEYNMLLAMAGQYMSIICERTVLAYVQLRRGSQQQRSYQAQSPTSSDEWATSDSRVPQNENARRSSSTDSVVGSGATGDGDMWFSMYRIQSNQERLQVLHCLVVVQLKELAQLLRKLKERAGSQNRWMLVLAEAENRVKSTQLLLCVAKD